MPTGLKIAHKGLILVAIPVVFELIFVSFLIVMLQQAESDLRKEIRSKEIIYTAGNFGRNVAEGATAIAAYSTTRSVFFKEKYRDSKVGMKKQLKNLKKLMKEADKQDQLKRLEKLELATSKGKAVLDKILESTEQKIAGKSPSFKFSGPLAMVSSKRMMTEIIQATQAIRIEEKLNAERYLKASSKSRERLQYLIMGFVGFNIFLAVILANYYSKSITHRLKTVVDNTYRVPKGEELTPIIGGNDEITELDSQFHSMVDELYNAQKMKQYLLSMVSHDLRSPLTSVQGLLTMLAAGAFGELSDKAKVRVNTAEAEINRLINMTNDLLDVEKLASGNLEMESLEISSEDISKATTGSMTSFAEQHSVKLKVDDPGFRLNADKDRLVQVMVNLVSNAIKYSPKGSTVTIKVEQDEDQTTFSVIDQGRGIPEEFVDKVFDKFQQVEESDSKDKGGKGLGLAICKSIVEAHGGTIGLDSSFGKGSTFWFTIADEKESIE